MGKSYTRESNRGHSALARIVERDRQDTGYVLACFGGKKKTARWLGITATAPGKELALSQPAVSKAAARGEEIVKEEGLTLRDGENKL